VKNISRQLRNDRGSVEGVLVYPVFLLAVLLILFGAFWANVNNLAHSIATAAYTNARIEGGSDASARALGEQLAANSGTTISAIDISFRRTATSVFVTVKLTVPVGLDGFHPTISNVVSGPRELTVAG
jgi:hypothetical protein